MIERNYIVIVSETGYEENKKEIEIVEIIFYVDKRKFIFTLPLTRIAVVAVEVVRKNR